MLGCCSPRPSGDKVSPVFSYVGILTVPAVEWDPVSAIIICCYWTLISWDLNTFIIWFSRGLKPWFLSVQSYRQFDHFTEVRTWKLKSLQPSERCVGRRKYYFKSSWSSLSAALLVPVNLRPIAGFCEGSCCQCFLILTQNNELSVCIFQTVYALPFGEGGRRGEQGGCLFNHSKHESEFQLINSGSLWDVLPIKCNAKD